MRNKRKPKRANGDDVLLEAENEMTVEINESFQHTVQLEKRASLFTTA